MPKRRSSTNKAERPARKDRLAEYRRKRSAEQSPEPFTGESLARPRLFVVQKHAARAMHFDLRLEMDGALQSWAVPRGPSLDPEIKRLAMEVEEHPLEYADFEGIIPEGNYGAGAVIVWDRGRWEPIGDPIEGMRRGKLLFDLWGYKLRGRWTLFRTKGKPNEWLLLKKPDAEADPAAELPQESIRSGLTVEELRDGVEPAQRVLSRLKDLRPRRRELRFETLRPMLARAREEPFSEEGWLFELKYDGYRLLGRRDGRQVALRYRRGADATAAFPEIAAALAALPFESLIVDGEVVVLDDTGRPSFQRLQQRVSLTRHNEISRATVELPATLFVFDLLAFDGYDLRPLALSDRKELLRSIVPPLGPLRFSDHIETEGRAMFEGVRELGLEGVMAKRAASPYVGQRSADWLKVRADRSADFAIVGYSAPKGSRAGFGALHLAVFEAEQLVYAGRVGSGFTGRQLKELYEELHTDRRATPPCSGTLPTEGEHTWVEPHRACEVRYKEWTADGLLRQPVFLRLRPDRGVEDCVRVDGPTPPEPPVVAQHSPAERRVSFTNRDKIFWPEEGYTKGDLIDYHRAVSPWLLPYLRDRPVVLTRYPDGIEGKSFFQKDAPGFIPGWLRTERMWSEHAKREIHYFVCDDEESLLYLVNLGTIPLHLWSSRVSTLQNPDWCILDLDPKQAPFEHVVRLARAARALCEEIGIDCFVKTSGSTGLHVLLPLAGQCTYEQSRTLAELLARILVAGHANIATIQRSTAARGGRVYVDYLQNGHGRLLVAPFSVRPLPGAPVSTPLRWPEVRAGLETGRYTIRSLPRRLRSMKNDPLRGVLDGRPDLGRALERLERRIGDLPQ